VSYLTDKKPLIFTFNCSRHDLTVNEAALLVRRGTHYPYVFIDDGSTRQLPPADFLSMFRLVITTNQRLKNEWSNGSFEDEHAFKRADAVIPVYRFSKPPKACSLLKVYWLRMVVDEGASIITSTWQGS
jgi:hypothetical protein